MPAKTIALINPPGWTLATGGPHLGLPMLAGALRRSGQSVFISDWNLELAKRFGAQVPEEQARGASEGPLELMNGPYFGAERALKTTLRDSTAAWEPQMGYTDAAYDASSPASVRGALAAPSPLDAQLIQLAGQLISECKPDLIGLGLIVPGQILPTFYIARALRNCGFSGPIVLGGNVVTRLAPELARDWVFDYFDALIVYQGESVLTELCRASARSQWKNIPNLLWRDQGCIRSNSVEVLAPEQFGPPDFRGFPLEDYWGAGFLTAIGSRGCYYGRCTFCSIPYSWGNGGFLGNDTPSAILRQFESGIHDHSVRRFKFADEAMHPGLFSRVADLVLARSLDVEFEGYARLDQSWLSPGLLERLSRAGLRKLYIGLEIAASRNRELLRKADHADPARFLQALAKNGISAHVFCMFGYPGTDEEDAIATVDFALQHEISIDTLDVMPFYYAKHTHVPGATVVERPGKEWALFHEYTPASPGVLTMQQCTDLAHDLESYLWRMNPRWLHPVYRLVSPWSNHGRVASEETQLLCGVNC